MPHSVFTGRVVAAGEALFLPDDTAKAMALAEEERDTCPRCGMQKAWCRDPRHQFAFEAVDEACWVSYKLAEYQNGDKWEAKGEKGQAAAVLSARFRDGIEPDIDAGLGLGEEGQRPQDERDTAHHQQDQRKVPQRL